MGAIPTPEVLRLTAAMARVQRPVSRGFVYLASGVIPLEKAERVVAKLVDRYDIATSEAEERARLRKGQARVRLTCGPRPRAWPPCCRPPKGPMRCMSRSSC
ncbi:MAG TPA: hypothetical protein VF265_08960 [Nevskiaceae bacterium]